MLDCDSTIYDNSIEMYFHEYFENRAIDISGDGYKRIETNIFNNAFIYIYKKLFKPSRDDRFKYNKTSKIDYDDVFLLNEIADIFHDICTGYNITGRQDMFCDMTGIHRSTLNRWATGKTRNSVYYDLDGNIISDIQAWKLNNVGEYVQAPTNAHCDIAKKIAGIHNKTAANKLNDFQNGQMMVANNEPDAGMEYNSKRQHEILDARQAVSAIDVVQQVSALPDSSADCTIVDIEQTYGKDEGNA